MKITVYTVSDCQFSRAEKKYLQLHNLSFEEKNLEQNREWLTEMLTISNNFAGTPVTKIEKDDGSIVVLKGFTKEEFDNELGLCQEPTNQVNAQVDLHQTPSSSTQPQPSSPTLPSQENQPITPQSTPDSTTSPSTQPRTPTSMPSSSNPSPAQLTNPTPITINQPLDQFNPPFTPSPSENNPSPSTTDQLNSILNDLQIKSQPQNSQTPTNLPNIPDFEDKS